MRGFAPRSGMVDQMPPDSGVDARFVCLRDPDGTVLELVETRTAQAG